jgi:DNA invertase Pin-like site-specific DNA recombinase
MTYKFNKQQHSTKIKEGLERAKKNGKKLGRPSGKIKGEDDVLYVMNTHQLTNRKNIARLCDVSLSTVRRTILKHKEK